MMAGAHFAHAIACPSVSSVYCSSVTGASPMEPAMAEQSTRVRLFLAINLPDAVRAALDGATAGLRSAVQGVRWVRAETLHVNLVFLGERPLSQVDALAAAAGAAGAQVSPFIMEVAGLGCFPSAARPRVLWAGITAGREQVAALQRLVLAVLVQQGLAAADDRFDPHVTFGRVRDTVAPGQRAAIGKQWAALVLPPLPAVRVDMVHLMRSELGPGGARYAPLCVLPLG